MLEGRSQTTETLVGRENFGQNLSAPSAILTRPICLVPKKAQLAQVKELLDAERVVQIFSYQSVNRRKVLLGDVYVEHPGVVNGLKLEVLILRHISVFLVVVVVS